MRAAGYRSGQQPDLQLPPPIPNLPGHTVYLPVADARKKSFLKFQNGISVVEEQKIAQDPTYQSIHNYFNQDEYQTQLQRYNQERERQTQDVYPQVGQGLSQSGIYNIRWTGKKTPGWLLHDKKVLRFYAYFVENISHSATEQRRVRRCQIRIFLEDDSIEIVEPAEPNSGLSQGTYLQRHKVKLLDGSPLKWNQFQVGDTVTIYARPFNIVGCDKATRDFYAEQNIFLPPDAPLPDGPYDVELKMREATYGRPLPSRMKGEDDPFPKAVNGPGSAFHNEIDANWAQFAKLDRKVLRFFCSWDNTDAVFGQKLPFALHYFLQDNTIEVAEVINLNSGRDPFPLLLSRTKLPKTPNVPPIEARPMSPETRRRQQIAYYFWKELRLGGVVRVYGRDLFLYDMDAFTRKWYQESMGLPASALQPIPVDFDMSVKRPEQIIPPNGAFGGEEDSLLNVGKLVPKRPIRDYNHFMANWSKVFRFTAKMVPVGDQAELPGPHDLDRRFVLSYHVVDQSISIFEQKQSNAGMKFLERNKFLERSKVRKPRSEEFLGEVDMYVGATLPIFSRGFLLTDADEYTLLYMEFQVQEEEEAAAKSGRSHPSMRFPFASFARVFTRICSAVQFQPQVLEHLKLNLMRQDSAGVGYVSRDALLTALRDAGIEVTPHEAITLVRQLGADRQGVVVEQLLAAIEDGITMLPANRRPIPPPGYDGYEGGDPNARQVSPAMGYAPEQQMPMVYGANQKAPTMPMGYEQQQQQRPMGYQDTAARPPNRGPGGAVHAQDVYMQQVRKDAVYPGSQPPEASYGVRSHTGHRPLPPQPYEVSVLPHEPYGAAVYSERPHGSDRQAVQQAQVVTSYQVIPPYGTVDPSKAGGEKVGRGGDGRQAAVFATQPSIQRQQQQLSSYDPQQQQMREPHGMQAPLPSYLQQQREPYGAAVPAGSYEQQQRMPYDNQPSMNSQQRVPYDQIKFPGQLPSDWHPDKQQPNQQNQLTNHADDGYERQCAGSGLSEATFAGPLQQSLYQSLSRGPANGSDTSLGQRQVLRDQAAAGAATGQQLARPYGLGFWPPEVNGSQRRSAGGMHPSWVRDEGSTLAAQGSVASDSMTNHGFGAKKIGVMGEVVGADIASDAGRVFQQENPGRRDAWSYVGGQRQAGGNNGGPDQQRGSNNNLVSAWSSETGRDGGQEGPGGAQNNQQPGFRAPVTDSERGWYAAEQLRAAEEEEEAYQRAGQQQQRAQEASFHAWKPSSMNQMGQQQGSWAAPREEDISDQGQAVEARARIPQEKASSGFDQALQAKRQHDQQQYNKFVLDQQRYETNHPYSSMQAGPGGQYNLANPSLLTGPGTGQRSVLGPPDLAPDPRFVVPPGAMGMRSAVAPSGLEVQRQLGMSPSAAVQAKLATMAADPQNRNRSSMDVLAKASQPPTLWQTTNRAPGGIYNPRSFDNNPRPGSSAGATEGSVRRGP